eukprot:397506-Amphidinium_carterae.1
MGEVQGQATRKITRLGQEGPVPRTRLYGAYCSRGLGVTNTVSEQPMVIKLARKLASHRPVHGWRADYAAFIIN